MNSEAGRGETREEVVVYTVLLFRACCLSNAGYFYISPA